MKILITHEVFPPEKFAGGERIVWEFTKRLKNKGFDVNVLTTGNPKIKEFEGVPTVRMPINRYMMNLAVPYVIKNAKEVDIIQTATYNACLSSYIAAKILKKPVLNFILGIHKGSWSDMRGHVFGTISKWVERIQLFRDYDKIIFFSEASWKKAIASGMRKKITEVIHPGVDHKVYYADKKENFVLFVGRLAKEKGLEYLIEAAKQLPEVSFKLVGSGELESYLKSIAPSNVKFLGYKTGKPLYDIYAKASIFCLPSVSDTFGLVHAEAMASGCAIISTIPLNYSGIKIRNKNVFDIVNAIKHLWENPTLVKKMGKENLEKSKEYDWDKFTKRMIEIYDKLV